MKRKSFFERLLMILDQEQLRSLLTYDEITGKFIWNIRRGPMSAGTTAGRVAKCGYVQIGIHGKRYSAHRLAWLYTHGEWPSGEIDHVNGNKIDNRISNLRDVTRSENMMNIPKRAHNTSGAKGVYWNKRLRKWQASIGKNRTLVHLGVFSTFEEAVAARVKAETNLYARAA